MPAGLLVKSQGGFYDVAVRESDSLQESIWCCRARGIFRKEGITPKVGDHVLVEQQVGGADAALSSIPETIPIGTITHIEPRKNELVRPLLANLDLLFLVISACDPAPNVFLLDQLLATSLHQGITPVVVFTKTDLQDTASLQERYLQAGFQVLALHHELPDTAPVWSELKTMMAGNVSALIGNSGVGKSTLLNRLYPAWSLQTGTISSKLGRGRHTTRHVQLHRLPPHPTASEQREAASGYVADTPGFGTMDFLRYQQSIRAEELAPLFLEFRPHLGKCQFTGCSHTVEQGCAILMALEQGLIAPARHQSYTALYEQLRKVPNWKKS